MIKISKIITLFVILALLNLSCGVYSFRGNNPPPGIKSIAVPLFEDVSGFSEAGLKEDFTELLKKKILNDNTFSLADKNISDGVLYCKITNIKDEALVITGNENVSKRKITISLTVRFENLKTKKLIWEKNYENWGEYNSSSQSFSERQQGIKTAQDKITEDILIDITSNW
jgi:hypothetical protein